MVSQKNVPYPFVFPSKFKKDFKKLSLSDKTAGTFEEIIDKLVSGEQLNEKFLDHPPL